MGDAPFAIVSSYSGAVPVEAKEQLDSAMDRPQAIAEGLDAVQGLADPRSKRDDLRGQSIRS